MRTGSIVYTFVSVLIGRVYVYRGGFQKPWICMFGVVLLLVWTHIP